MTSVLDNAGIVLVGSEVKSCRKGGVSISDGLAEIIDGEVVQHVCKK